MNKVAMKDIIKIRREVIDRCTTILQSFGYQNINIETGVSQYGNIKEVKAYFWNNKYGYSIEISSESCMVIDVEKIINFVSNPIDMSEIDINTIFEKYLIDNQFQKGIVASCSNKDGVILSTFKDENKYIIHIHRQIACTKIEENNDELQVFDANEIAAYKQKLDKILKEIIKINSYEIEVSPDLQNICISVSGDLVKYFLNILCYENLNWWCDEDVIYEIIKKANN
jgi:hypothetical protein